MKKHNGTIALWKFIYCFMIIALHLGTDSHYIHVPIRFAGGSIGVEFFFIVSGFLLGAKALSKTGRIDIGEETKKYMLKRVLNLMGMTFIVFVFSYFFFTYINDYAMYNKANFIWDILLLRNAGIPYKTLIYVGWYTSVLVIMSLVLYPLVLKYKNKFLYIIGPIIIFFIGSYIAYNWNGSIAWDGEYYTKCLLRGLFEMSIGICLNPIVKKIKNTNFTILGKSFLTMVENLGFISILFLTNTDSSHIKYDYIMILIFAICVSIAFSQMSFTAKFTSNKLIFNLEKLSFPMYLSQGLIIGISSYFFDFNDFSYYEMLFIVIVECIIFSIVCLAIRKFCIRYLPKIKQVFIKEVKA